MFTELLTDLDFWRSADSETLKTKSAQYIAWFSHDGRAVSGLGANAANRTTHVLEGVKKVDDEARKRIRLRMAGVDLGLLRSFCIW